jgi:hypothetical protein
LVGSLSQLRNPASISRKDADDRIPRDQVPPTVAEFQQTHPNAHDYAPSLNAIATAEACYNWLPIDLNPPGAPSLLLAPRHALFGAVIFVPQELVGHDARTGARANFALAYLCPPEAEMRLPVTHAIALFEAD